MIDCLDAETDHSAIMGDPSKKRRLERGIISSLTITNFIRPIQERFVNYFLVRMNNRLGRRQSFGVSNAIWWQITMITATSVTIYGRPASRLRINPSFLKQPKTENGGPTLKTELSVPTRVNKLSPKTGEIAVIAAVNRRKYCDKNKCMCVQSKVNTLMQFWATPTPSGT